MLVLLIVVFFFFFNDTATTEIYTLSLHDALPILGESPSQLAPTQWAPVQVVNLTNVVAIGSGAYHSMALRSDGTLWVWGDNTYGELGSTAPSNPAIATVPQVVQFPSGTVIVAIAAGQGSSFALDNTGTVWAWGTQIGNAVTTYNASPTKVVFPSPT